MVENKQITSPMHTERSAFPVYKSILAGILSLLLIRYIFGLIPLSYPTNKESVDFYYKGTVVGLPTPSGFCLTMQSDILDNIAQVADFFFHYPQKFYFVTFRSLRPCSDTYDEQNLVFGYERFITLKHYFHWLSDEVESHSPKVAGFVGMGAELLPLSASGIQQWLGSVDTKRQIQGPYIPSKLLSFFPRFDGFDESLMVDTHHAYQHTNGYCSVTTGIALEIDNAVFDGCDNNPKTCVNVVKTYLEDYWQARASNNMTSHNQTMTDGAIVLSLYTSNFSGRSLYYGLAKEIDVPKTQQDSAEALAWGLNACRLSEQAVSSDLSSHNGQRGIIGFSN